MKYFKRFSLIGSLALSLFFLISIPSASAASFYSLSNSAGNLSITKPVSDATPGGVLVTGPTVTSTWNPYGGPPQEVSCSFSGVPSGVYFSYIASCRPTGTYSFDVRVLASAVAGIYPITITGSPLGETTTFTLTISNPSPPSFNYSLSNSGAIAITKSSSNFVTGSNTITSSLTESPTQEMSFSSSGLPANVSGSFSPTSCTPNCTSTFTASVQSSAVAGTYPITITGSPLGRTTTFNLVISNPSPPTGTLTPSSSSCTIASGANSCTQTLTWTTTNPVGTSAVTSPTGTPSPANGNNGSQAFTVPYNASGVNFFLYNNAVLLAQAAVTTTCASGSTWNGSSCIANPTGTLSLSPTSCVIASGASTCSTVYATWTTTNATDPKLVDGNTGTTLSTLANKASPGLQVWVAYPQTVFNLKNGSTILDTKTATATCAAESAWNGSSCVATSLSIAVSPSNYSATLPNSTISATYTLANGTSANTNCRLLNNVGSPLSVYAPCIGSMSVTAPTVSGTYGYFIQANKSSTGETVASNKFTVTVNVDAPTCSNGTDNPPTCDQCPSGLAYIGGSCVACSSGGCSGIGGTPENPTGNLICNNGAANPQECNTFTPTPTLIADSYTLIERGQSAILSWNSAGSVSCAFVGTPANGISTGGAISGSVSTGPLTETQNYQIICTDAEGNTSAPALVTIIVLQPNASISANPARIQAGTNSTISWDTSQMEECSTSGPGLATSALLSGSQEVTILSQSTYTITCQSNEGNQVTQSVTVNILPLFQEF